MIPAWQSVEALEPRLLLSSDPLAAAPAAPPTVWGAQPDSGRIVLIDPSTGFVKGSLPAPDRLSPNHRTIGLTIAEGGNSLLSYNDNVEPDDVWRLDPWTGAVQNIVAVPGGPLFGLGASAHSQLGEIHGTKWQDVDGDGTRDPGDDGLRDWTIDVQGSEQLFAGVGNGSPVSPGGLLLVDENTGAGTLVGDPGSNSGGGLAFAPNGTLYATQFSGGGLLHTVNPTNGRFLSATSVVDAVNGFLDGLGVRPSDGTIFGTRSNSGSAGEDVVTIDPTTGVTTFIGSTGAGTISDLDFRRGLTRQETTNANGEWWSMGLPPNTYTVSERLQFGWVQTAPLASESFGLEDLTLGKRYLVGDSFTTVGTLGRVVKVTGSDFIFGNGNPFPGGFSDVENGGLAGGTGNELEVNNINLNFDFGGGVGGMTVKFGEYGGNLNININNDFLNFQIFADIDGKTIGGTLVGIQGGPGADIGVMTIDGPVSSFALGGQELWIDMPTIQVPPAGNAGVHVVDLGARDVVTGIDFGNQRIIAVEIDQFPDTRALIGLDLVGVGMQSAILSGPAEVHVFFEGPNDGDAFDDDGDNLDDVDTEMVQLDLTGNISGVGPVILRLNPNIKTTGQIEEDADTQTGRLDLQPFAPSGTAFGFFDVFFEIDLPQLGLTLHNQVASRLKATIDHKPPGNGTHYLKPQGAIDLFDQNNNLVGQLITARHTPDPIEVDTFDRTRALIGLRFQDGSTRSVRLVGPSTVHVDLGALQDTDNNGREQVPTEVVQLDLTGNAPGLRQVNLSLNPDIPTLGEIEENVNAQNDRLDLPPFAPSGTAESFFDVFFQVESPCRGTPTAICPWATRT